ncbi:MAG: hypothetical protein HOP10_07405 [Chitinophagaceae bacterium]|nr:hypothetical protein [Chitinophagaceae bacterium]
MKNIFIPILLLFVLLNISCSKESFDEKIVGTWNIVDVDRHGSGSDPGHLPFREGQFTFSSDGTLIYTKAGVTYNGTWNIQRKTFGDDSFQALEIMVIDFATQVVLSEYYDDINFSGGASRMKACIHEGRHSYTTHFRK